MICCAWISTCPESSVIWRACLLWGCAHEKSFIAMSFLIIGFYIVYFLWWFLLANMVTHLGWFLVQLFVQVGSVEQNFLWFWQARFCDCNDLYPCGCGYSIWSDHYCSIFWAWNNLAFFNVWIWCAFDAFKGFSKAAQSWPGLRLYIDSSKVAIEFWVASFPGFTIGVIALSGTYRLME